MEKIYSEDEYRQARRPFLELIAEPEPRVAGDHRGEGPAGPGREGSWEGILDKLEHLER